MDQAERLIRASSPALDEILGQQFPVLDNGFIRVIDYMGNDSSIVQAARVSYGKGTKHILEDRGLIRYLMRHRHTTPFEMCDIKLHVRVPMDTWRQWIRHRTACLAEGTEIFFDLPGGIKRRGNQLYKLKIEEIWKRFQPTQNKIERKQRNPYHKRDVIKNMKLRQINEKTLKIQHTNIINVYKNGRKHVFKITLSDGKQIEATADHKFLFKEGWKTLNQATGVYEKNKIAVWNKGNYNLYTNGTEIEIPAYYQDKDWLNTQYNLLNKKIEDISDECKISYHTIRKWIRKHKIQHKKGGRSKVPWNKGKTYKSGKKEFSEKNYQALLKARSGKASNFWKGGTSTERENIGRWTTQIAHKIHEKNRWTCQLCHERAKKLHCHHIVPVWADLSLAKKESNLTTLCVECHKKVHENEIDYVEILNGPIIKKQWEKRPRTAWNKLIIVKLTEIKNIEFIGIKETYDLEVKGPNHNFIANGIVTHNSVNEYSTRYSQAIDEKQRTNPEQWRTQATGNRQGSSGFLDEVVGADLTAEELRLHEYAQKVYQDRLELGVAREQARKDLPLSNYTEAYWKIDLHNLLHFLGLRMDSHAQLEIRSYADIIGNEIVSRWVPLTWSAFQDYGLQAMRLSKLEKQVIATISTGNLEAANDLAKSYGWLEKKEDKLKQNREREEIEMKLRALGIKIPWQ